MSQAPIPEHKTRPKGPTFPTPKRGATPRRITTPSGEAHRQRVLADRMRSYSTGGGSGGASTGGGT